MKILVGGLPLAPRSDVRTAASFEDVLDTLAAHRRERVLVITEPEEYEHASRVARNAVAGPDIVVVVVDGFRTARVQLAAGLCRLTPEHYGLAAAVRDELARQVHTRLALKGLGRLSVPAPTVRQQISGWWPGARFEVDTTAGTITRAASFAWGVPADRIAVEAAHDPKGSLKVGHDDAGPDLVLEAPARPGYASRVWAEQSVGPRDIDEVVARLCATVPVLTCPMCANLRSGDLCLWCGCHGVPELDEPGSLESLGLRQPPVGRVDLVPGDTPGSLTLQWTISDDDLRSMGVDL